jgi:nucleoid-associated protein YejK
MLDNSAQFAVDEEELSIEKLTTLNLDELVRANRLNINKWVNEEGAYLSFIKGKRQISKFFQKFIGNTDLTSSKINANNLKDSMQEFMRSANYSQSKKSKVFSAVKSYVDKMVDSEKDVELKSISAIMNPEMPEEFIDYTVDNDKNISENFRSNHKTDFKFLYQSSLSGEGYNLIK